MATLNSAITNPGALTALRTLNGINRSLDQTQNRISTGLRIANAIDDSSNFSIAQGIRAEIGAFGAITQGLNTGQGVGKVALAGTTGLSNLLTDVRAKLTELSNEGITTSQRSVLQNDYNKLISQAAAFITNSTFNGLNLIESGAANVNILSNLSGNTLTLTAQDLRTQTNSLGGATLATATNAQSVISNEFTNLESSVNVALGSLGSEIRALVLQNLFIVDLVDVQTEALGSIVDADLARASARLTALQVQQQLSVQTLGIANQRPQALLPLFE
ncbi:MAG: flagellin [Rhodospirillaceae bacterium]|jgi:flagellin|nr:flagellin [Rhodospirillaceae bacterium]MBT6139277.1 flagellin [Rhodospirillaceae bacterium]